MKRISKKRFAALEVYAAQMRDQRDRAIVLAHTEAERATNYFKRLQELKAKISDIDLLLKFDNYTEDEMYLIPMQELRQLANEQLAGKRKLK